MSAATEFSRGLPLGTRIYYGGKVRQFELKGNFYHNLSISAEMLAVCPRPPNWGATHENLVYSIRNVGGGGSSARATWRVPGVDDMRTRGRVGGDDNQGKGRCGLDVVHKWNPPVAKTHKAKSP